MYFVYILKTNKNTLYTGQTNNLDKRIEKHKTGKGSKYLRAFSSFELVYTETCETLSKALIREAEIKRLTKKQKHLLFESSRRTGN